MELPRLFKDISEITSRPKFDGSCAITTDNFAGLIGEYQLSADEICQVHKQDGRCGHKHRHGWVGKTKEEKECLIGGHCAIKYFKANELFRTERARVTRELNITDYLSRIATMTSSDVESRIELQSERLALLRQAWREITEALPDDLVREIHNRVKTGRFGVNVELRFTEKGEDGKEITTWVPRQIGSLSGLAAWNEERFRELNLGLGGIKGTIRDLDPRRDAGETKLKKWTESLESITKLTTLQEDLQADVDAFSEPENLLLCSYLVRSDQERLIVAKLIMARNGQPDASNNSARAILKDNDDAIRKRLGRDFRRVT